MARNDGIETVNRIAARIISRAAERWIACSRFQCREYRHRQGLICVFCIACDARLSRCFSADLCRRCGKILAISDGCKHLLRTTRHQVFRLLASQSRSDLFAHIVQRVASRFIVFRHRKYDGTIRVELGNFRHYSATQDRRIVDRIDRDLITIERRHAVTRETSNTLYFSAGRVSQTADVGGVKKSIRQLSFQREEQSFGLLILKFRQQCLSDFLVGQWPRVQYLIEAYNVKSEITFDRPLYDAFSHRENRVTECVRQLRARQSAEITTEGRA